MNDRKREQLQHAVRAAIQEVLARGLADPRIRGLITVTEVRVTTDRRSATVLVSVYPEERAELTMHGLHDAERHIRHEVGDLIRTRVMPTLTFKRDDRPKKDAAVLRAINVAADAGAGQSGAGRAAPGEEQSPAGTDLGGEGAAPTQEPRS